MSGCIDHEVLDAFATGDLGEACAVRVAQHLDECPSCATYAATAEPLAAEFAAMDDPRVPDDLARSVIAICEQQTSDAARREVWWAGILIGLSVALLPGIWRVDALTNSLAVLTQATQKVAWIAMDASLPYLAIAATVAVAVSLWTGGAALSTRVRSPR